MIRLIFFRMIHGANLPDANEKFCVWNFLLISWFRIQGLPIESKIINNDADDDSNDDDDDDAQSTK